MTICPNLADNKVREQFQELVEAVGENGAYYIWDVTNGTPIEQTIEGKPSKLFKDLLNHFNGDRIKAIAAKATIFTNSYRKLYGDYNGFEPSYKSVLDQNNYDSQAVYNTVKRSIVIRPYVSSEGKYMIMVFNTKSGYEELSKFRESFPFVKLYNSKTGKNWRHYEITQPVEASIPNTLLDISLKEAKERINKEREELDLLGRDEYKRLSQPSNEVILSGREREHYTYIKNKLSKLISIPHIIIEDSSIEGYAQVDGAKINGKVVIRINPLKTTRDAIGHEFGHIVIDAIGGMSNTLVKNVRNELVGSELEREVIERYPDLSKDELDVEIVAEALGYDITTLVGTTSIGSKLITFLRRLLDSIRARLGLSQSALRELSTSFLNNELNLNSFDVKTREKRKVNYLRTEAEIVDALTNAQLNFEYDDATHTYTRKSDGKVFQSVTQSMSDIGYGPDLSAMSQDEEDRMNISASIGTVIHGIFEQNFKGLTPVGVDNAHGVTMSEEAKNHIKNVIIPSIIPPGARVLSEVKLYDNENEKAGTGDVIYILNNRVYMLDFKTKTSKYKFDFYERTGGKAKHSDSSKYHLQLSAYEQMLANMGIVLEGKGIVGIEVEMDGNVITKVKLNRTISKTGIDFMNGLHPESNKIIKEVAELDSIEGEAYEALKVLRLKLVRSLEATSFTLSSLNRRGLSEKMREKADKLAQLPADVSIQEYVELAKEQIMEIHKEYMTELANSKLNGDNSFQIRTVQRWMQLTKAYDALGDILAYYEDSRLYNNEGTPEYAITEAIIPIIHNIMAKKNIIEGAYKKHALPKLIDFLSKISTRAEAEYRKEAEIKFNKTQLRDSSGKKIKFSKGERLAKETEFKEKYVKDNEEAIKKRSREIVSSEIGNASRDTNTLYRWVDNILDSDDVIIGSIAKEFAERHLEAKQKIFKKRSEVVALVKELEAIIPNGLSTTPQDFYDFMIAKDALGKRTNYIATRFSYAFMEEYREMMSLTASIANSSERNKSRNAWLDSKAPYDKEEYAKTKVKIFKKYLKDGLIDSEQFDRLIYNESSTFESRQSYEDMLGEDVGEQMSTEVQRAKNKLRKVTDEAYLDDTYKKLEALDPSDPRRKFYKLIVEMSDESHQGIPSKFSLIDALSIRMPGILKDNRERIKSEGLTETLKWSWNSMKNLSSLGLDEEITTSNDQRFINTNPDGTITKIMPVYHTNIIEPEQQSYDIASIFYEFYSMAANYNAKASILPEIEMVRDMLKERKVKALDGKGNPLYAMYSKFSNHALGKEQASEGLAENYYNQFNDWVDNIFYGIKLTSKRTGTVKLFEKLNSLTSFTLLGLNWVQGINNVVLGESLQKVEALMGEYVTLEGLNKASLLYDKEFLNGNIVGDVGARSPRSIVNLVAEYFGIEQSTDAIMRQNTKFRQLSKQSSVFFLMRSGEHWMRTRFLIGTLYDKKVHDAKGNEYRAMDLFYNDNGNIKFGKLKDGTVVDIIDFNEDAMRKHGLHVERILSALHGEYGELGAIALQRNIYGKMLVVFRKWIVPGWKRRWDREKYIESLGEFREGAYYTWAKFLGATAKELRVVGLGIFGANQESWNNLTRHEKNNVRKATLELTTMFVLLPLIGMLLSGMDDDDDKAIGQLRYQVARFGTELRFFVNPLEAWKLLQSPAAGMSVIGNMADFIAQLSDPLDVYQNGPYRGTYKLEKKLTELTPLYRQLHRWNDVHNELSWIEK